MEKTLSYFVADIHLGLDTGNPLERGKRFLDFLKGIKAEETENLFLLGDIWDFWWEYKYVVPKGSERLIATLLDLIDGGVNVYFFEGNHDMWDYGYFESLGIKKCEQPYLVEIAGKTFCLGHGDCLGPTPKSYRCLYKTLHNRFLRWCFSTLHPRIAFWIATNASLKNRKSHEKKAPYVFVEGEAPICVFAKEKAEETTIDYFVFGHYHKDICWKFTNSTGKESTLYILKDWFEGSPVLVYDSKEGKFTK